MKEPVYLLGLELENVRCFGEKAKLDLSDGNGNWQRWTVILGDNGTGKTTLLQILAFTEIERELRYTENRFGPKKKLILNFLTKPGIKTNLTY